MNNLEKMQTFGSEYWVDSFDVEEIKEAISAGAVGLTSNPILYRKVYGANPTKWREGAIHAISCFGREIASLFQPIYRASNQKQGYVAIHVDPRICDQTAKLVEQGKTIAGIAENVVVKIPATSAGVEAIGMLAAEGLHTMATAVMTMAQVKACVAAVEKTKGRHWIAMIIGRLNDYVDLTDDKTRSEYHWPGIALYKKAYQTLKKEGFPAALLHASFRHVSQWYETLGVHSTQTLTASFKDKILNTDAPVQSLVNNVQELSLSDSEVFMNPSAMNISDVDTFTPVQKLMGDFIQAFAAIEN